MTASGQVPTFFYTCDDGKASFEQYFRAVDRMFATHELNADEAEHQRELIYITHAERTLLAELSESIDNCTFLGDGDRNERAFWKRASTLRSVGRKSPERMPAVFMRESLAMACFACLHGAVLHTSRGCEHAVLSIPARFKPRGFTVNPPPDFAPLAYDEHCACAVPFETLAEIARGFARLREHAFTMFAPV